MRIVMKFGGTSLGDVDTIRHVAALLKQSAARDQVVLVVSAINAAHLRTTDLLIEAARAAAAGDVGAAVEVAARLRDWHLEVARGVVPPEDDDELEDFLTATFDYVADLYRSIAILGELTPRGLDLISGQGERCNARIVAAALRAATFSALSTQTPMRA